MKTRHRTIQRTSVDTVWLNLEIGKRLRTLRTRKGCTLQVVADALGVTRASVNNWELGKHQNGFMVARIYDLALFYKVSPKDLLP